jgi:hypothetical protein
MAAAVSAGRPASGPRARRLARGLLALALAWVTLLAPAWARAENTVALWGNYYLERSTRVISPMAAIAVDLPHETELELTYLVDNITSASGTFQAELNDEPFQEFRQEARVAVSTELFGFLRPGILARYSYEPDYTSLTYGLSLTANLFDDLTTVTLSGQRQNDAIMARGNNFEDTLDTWRLALNVTQVVTPNLVVGASLETQILDGYTQNPYREEFHPRQRERYAMGAYASYRLTGPGTTVRLGYRYYWDDWDIQSHRLDLHVFQRLGRDLEIVPHIRVYDQQGVVGAERPFPTKFAETGISYFTNDPKLFDLGTTGLGLRVIWTLGFLEGTALDGLRDVSIQPRYMFFAQRNDLELNPLRIIDPEPGSQTQFGDAHIAQLGVCWPF